MRRTIRIGCCLAAVLSYTTIACGQVFTQAEGAVEGPTQMGVGQKLYGGMGLDSANNSEFLIYRKYLRIATDEPLSSATNVDGNPGEMEWINVNQRQGAAAGSPNTVLTAPGMFIGQNNHKTEDGWVVSNPDQILYFKPLIDNLEDAATNDSNRNVLWDARFGFMEDPDAFVDFVEPNSEQLDLWTGQFNTDAVYLQNAIQRDDSKESTNVTSQVGHGGSFKQQSGSEFTTIANEGSRTSYEIERFQAGTDEELDRIGQLDAGVAYEDAIEISWGMRLNDPGDPDEIFGREVQFWVKTGNIIASGIFDPGGGEDSPTDFPPNDPTDPEDFTDFIFNWQDAKPVFFAGAQGLAQGTGRMGIFTPGDFGADGAVNLDDFNRLAANYGDAATTYSRGDFTQDGLTDAADATAWAGLASDAVKSEAVAAVTADLGGTAYDFDGSGTTDDADVSFITELFGVTGGGCVITEPVGDFDGDGEVAFLDFLTIANNFDTDVATYAEGDANCDGTVSFLDFLELANHFGETAGNSAAAVPEPNSCLLVMIGGVLLSLIRRKRS